jgi:ATP-binding cassette subfamily B protein
MITALAYGGYLTISGRISLGDFVALTFYIRLLMNPLQQIGNVINVMQRSRAAWKRLNDLIGVQPDIVEADDALPVRLHNDAVRVKGLSFAYPGSSREVLQDINLTIEPGATVGIIGRTGSGKTTLIKLLMRMYDPPEGTVFIGETDIRRASLDSLRDQIAYVPQDGFLFSTTIRDNIAFARRDASREEIEDAARQARIYDNIVRFPDGFLTRLGERGLTLSGGQRQRTSLARGLLKQAPLIILDDSVSAVDAVTETEIIRSLQEERRGKTTIIIAHRISALKHADLILVMDKGRIVQRGRHEELIAQPGLYADFYAIQEEGKRHAAGHS